MNPTIFKNESKKPCATPKTSANWQGADAVGTAGSAACGDMIRLWIKFKEQAGKK